MIAPCMLQSIHILMALFSADKDLKNIVTAYLDMTYAPKCQEVLTTLRTSIWELWNRVIFIRWKTGKCAENNLAEETIRTPISLDSEPLQSSRFHLYELISLLLSLIPLSVGMPICAVWTVMWLSPDLVLKYFGHLKQGNLFQRKCVHLFLSMLDQRCILDFVCMGVCDFCYFCCSVITPAPNRILLVTLICRELTAWRWQEEKLQAFLCSGQICYWLYL